MMDRILILGILTAVAAAAAPTIAEPSTNPVIDRGFRQMYDLNFGDAHKTFEQWERDHPEDPIGPVSNAAAYLFAEFDRLNILHSEFFTDNSMFHRRPKVTPDPAVRQAFDQELDKSAKLSGDILGREPEHADALFAKILTLGLRADYEALIERRDFDALKVIKDSRSTAEKLLLLQPNYYDAYLAVGVENYLFSLKSAPMRWILQAGGLELLDVATIARLKEVDVAASTGLSTMAHYQRLSDELIVPHLGQGRSFFYDPETKQLRPEYGQYPDILREGSRILHELSEKTNELVTQLRTEQTPHRR